MKFLIFVLIYILNNHINHRNSRSHSEGLATWFGALVLMAWTGHQSIGIYPWCLESLLGWPQTMNTIGDFSNFIKSLTFATFATSCRLQLFGYTWQESASSLSICEAALSAVQVHTDVLKNNHKTKLLLPEELRCDPTPPGWYVIPSHLCGNSRLNHGFV